MECSRQFWEGGRERRGDGGREEGRGDTGKNVRIQIVMPPA